MLQLPASHAGTNFFWNPFLLDQALGDDPPILGGTRPDATLDNILPGLAHFPAVVEGFKVDAFLFDESIIQYSSPDFRREPL